MAQTSDYVVVKYVIKISPSWNSKEKRPKVFLALFEEVDS